MNFPVYTQICTILMLCCFNSRSNQISIDHEYYIKEELPIGTQIGNLFEDVIIKLIDMGMFKASIMSNSKQDLPNLFSMKIVNYADSFANAFEIKPDGRLLITRRLDRDQLCPTYQTTSVVDTSEQLNSVFSNPRFSNNNVETNSLACPITLQVALINQKTMQDHSDPTDAGSEEKKSNRLISIRIHIQDINDNAPFWQGHLQRFRVNFRDGDPVGTKRNLPPALDPDTGLNARVSYELLPVPEITKSSIPFRLTEDPVDGLYLYATKPIDREEQADYKLYLKAIDGVSNRADLSSLPSKQFTSTLFIDISVEDVNDNAPRFTQSIFTTSNPISETTPVGTTILVLNATDLDSGTNGAFHFSFSKEHFWLPAEELARLYFDVRPNGHIIIRQPLNVDKMDSGYQSINRLTSNPSLDSKSLHFIQSHPTSAMHQPRTIQFRFRVIVEDEAIRPYTKSSEASVVILVVDENDEAPIINVLPNTETMTSENLDSLSNPNAFNHLSVIENQPIGTLVANIQVYDPDFGGTDQVECSVRNSNFSLVRSNQQQQLQQQKSSTYFDQASTQTEYHLITTVAIDREVTPHQLLTILCSDMAGHFTERNITIRISDINDNPPKFVKSTFYLQVEENAPRGTHVRQSPIRDQEDSKSGHFGPSYHWITATDADAGPNSATMYQLIENGQNSTHFTIDAHTGLISTSMTFDRESKDRYTLQVLAIDRGNPPMTGTATVQINILDLNDNVPQFSQPDYTFHVLENQPRITPIGQLLATDADSNIYGPISYSLLDERDAATFSIDPNTGVIRARQPLDREEKSRYTFRVLAKDALPNLAETSLRQINPSVSAIQHTGTVTVTVIVDDVNDNWPVFISPNSTANTLAIAIDQTLGHKLAYIQAEDQDDGENGLISYSIRAGNNHGLFGLDPVTGLLFLSGSLDHVPDSSNLSHSLDGKSLSKLSHIYEPSFHILTLEACDHGSDPKPRCTLFNNLKILIQNSKDLSQGLQQTHTDSQNAQNQQLHLQQNQLHQSMRPNQNQPGLTQHHGNNLRSLFDEGTIGITDSEHGIKSPTALAYGESVLGKQLSTNIAYSTNEIMVICLSLVFALVLVATLVLVCLVRRRLIWFRAQKKANVSLEKKDEEWTVHKSSTHHLARDSSLAFAEIRNLTDDHHPGQELCKPGQNYDNSLTEVINSGHEASLMTEPLSESQYHLLSPSIEYKIQDSQLRLHNANSPLPTDIRQLTPANALVGPICDRRRILNGHDDYQTLDYLGLVCTTLPSNRFTKPMNMVTYSPGRFTSSRFMAYSPDIHDIDLTSSTVLPSMNPLSRLGQPANQFQDPIGSMPNNYQVTHFHSQSQPQPLVSHYQHQHHPNRYMGFPTLTSAGRRNNSHDLASYGPPHHTSTQPYQTILGSVTNANGWCYASGTARYPPQSHTYHDIRQPDSQVQTAAKVMPKSKSQQLGIGGGRGPSLNGTVKPNQLCGIKDSNQLISSTELTTSNQFPPNNIVETNSDNEVSANNVQQSKNLIWQNSRCDDRSKEQNKDQMDHINSTSCVNSTMVTSTSTNSSGKYMSSAYRESSFV